MENGLLKKTLKPAGAILFAALFASPVLAAEPHWMYGTWCTDIEIMYVGNSGVAFNEHTVCGWTQNPEIASPATIPLACRNVHFLDDVAVESDHEMMTLQVTKVDANTLSILFRDKSVPEVFGNCAE